MPSSWFRCPDNGLTCMREMHWPSTPPFRLEKKQGSPRPGILRFSRKIPTIGQTLRQFCRCQRALSSGRDKCADRFGAQRQPLRGGAHVLFYATNAGRCRDAHWDIARVSSFSWMHSDAGRDRSSDLRACQSGDPGPSDVLARPRLRPTSCRVVK